MEFLEIVLQEAQICDVPLLFILDHFSSFCQKSKQTLLYTLLDMCSNKNVQMCVIGIDRDCAITELLEKRIQSRFSQKQIIVPYPSITHFIQFTSSLLFLQGSDSATRTWNSKVKEVVLHEDFSRLIEEQSMVIPLSYHIHLIELNWIVWMNCLNELFEWIVWMNWLNELNELIAWIIYPLLIREMRRIILYAISRLPDNSEGMTIQFWKECFEHILLQNTTERNTVLQCKDIHW